MRCPFCNGELEEGYLQGMNRVAWVKQPHKLSLKPKQGEILLENNVINDFLFPASICKSCKKIIVNYQGKEIEEGR